MRNLPRVMLVMLLLLVSCGRTVPRPTPTPRPSLSYRVFIPPVFSGAASGTETPGPLPAFTAAYPAPGGSPLTAFFRNGQTFLTWQERKDLTGERYRIYRSSAPITAKNLPQAQLLAQVGEHSSRIWGNYFVSSKWQPRLSERFIFTDNAAPLEEGLGGLVWTLGVEDFGGNDGGAGYYAVTIIPPPSSSDKNPAQVFSSDYTTGPVQEKVENPLPVEITHSPGIKAGAGGHFYLQYVDLRHYNPTFHAPNATNKYYGFDPARNDFSNELAYTYDYSIFEPTPDLCGGSLPDSLPVMIFLHGARGNRYATPQDYIYPYCAYGIYPVDQSETWYFGFARSHDYRTDTPIEAGDVIENYTEQRVLRMVYDLMRKPPGPPVDQQRVYLFGHSMGGTGSLAFAERYPNVFAAIYSGQPVTQFRAVEGYDDPWPADLARKWGAQSLNLPVHLSAPNGWASPLQKYNGVGIYDWEDLRAAFDPRAVPNRSGDEMVPFGIDHGFNDKDVLFPTQGQRLYPLLVASPRAWAGAVSEAEHHWSVFGWPLPNLAKLDTGRELPKEQPGPAPFWNLTAIRDETVPGLSNLSTNHPGVPDSPTTYNQTILWSASWNAWDGGPVDQPDLWKMSLCAVAAGKQQCGSGKTQVVSITPRRLQHFVITDGQKYDWENRLVGRGDGRLIASGTVTAQGSLLTIPGVQISPGGNRLVIWPHKGP